MERSEVEAALRANEGGTIAVLLANRTGHPEKFHVSGVVPECWIDLDGNARYSVNLSPNPESTIVEVRRESQDGELLAYRHLDTQEDNTDGS
jgi:hypothetical protein